MFGHDICWKGRLYTFSTFSAFTIHNSVSLWVKITRRPNSLGRPSLCFARKQGSSFATGCDVINRWIIVTRNFAKSWAPPWSSPKFLHRNHCHTVRQRLDSKYARILNLKFSNVKVYNFSALLEIRTKNCHCVRRCLSTIIHSFIQTLLLIWKKKIHPEF